MRPFLRRVLDFAHDRWIWMLAMLIGGTAVAAVFALDEQFGNDMRIPSFLYAVLLLLFFLFLGFVLDYVRQAPYERALRRLERRATGDEFSVWSLPAGGTRTQRRYRSVLIDRQRDAENKLEELRRQADARYLFTLRWVHQMKTPLAVIDLLLQEADCSDFDRPKEEWLDSLREEQEKLQHGLETMLHQARLDPFAKDARFKQVALVELMRQAVNAHKSALIRSAVFPVVEGEPDLAVETDEKWLQFILHQLISNAIKYSKPVPGNKQLILRAVRTEREAELSVADQGIGIPPEDLDRVFEPFFTGANGRVTGESTGMGLYLAREACRRLGHRIRIASAPGQGATVVVTFPAQAIHQIDGGDVRET